mmetsp:Transcript_12411/g.56507  ORF Transcript_12411/g.56507 Transcript_12411/m.56507 type:complete len:201 (+) Transcript_12411:1469-2071(+)
MFSPSSFATRLRFLKLILPVSSSSKRRKAFMISSRESRSPILAVIMVRNSSKSMVPEPSLSMSAIIFLISSFLGSKPRARMATLSSLASMVPEPSVSKRSNASRISCFCSSVSPVERPLPLSRRAEPTAWKERRGNGSDGQRLRSFFTRFSRAGFSSVSDRLSVGGETTGTSIPENWSTPTPRARFSRSSRQTDADTSST